MPTAAINTVIPLRLMETLRSSARHSMRPSPSSVVPRTSRFAYVAVRDGADWVEQAKLIGGSVSSSDRFGWAVDVDGDYAVVTSLFDQGASPVSGTATVFQRGGSSWSQTQILAPTDGATSDWFGRSVSIQGNTIAIGAPQDDDFGAECGSVYIYTFNGTSWIQQSKLTAADANAGDNFGQSVALSGASIVIGAPFDDDAGSSSGSAYIFTFNGTSWNQQAKLTASDASSSDSFGYGVALDGDTALVGAYRANLGGFGSDAGAAYVYTRSAVTWSQSTKLVPASLAAGDDCAWSVALDGEHALLSARGHANNQGSVFHFRNSVAGWVEVNELVASDGAVGDEFSLSIDLDGERAMVGAYLHDGAGGSAGAAYLFDLFRVDVVPAAPIAGQPASINLGGGKANSMSWMAYSLNGAGSTSIAPLGVTLDLLFPSQLGSAQLTASDGSASWPIMVPAQVSGVTVWLQGLQAGHVTNLRSLTVL